MSIILLNGDMKNTSWLQKLVVIKSLIMAAKGPAEEFLAERIKQENDSGDTLYHEKGLKEKLLLLGMIY